MTALDVPYTTLRELQTQLDLLAGMLLGSLAKILRPRLVVREGDTGTKVAAFLMENRPGQGPLRRFLVPLDQVEALSGIDFFPGLSEQQQHTLEGTARAEDWAF